MRPRIWLVATLASIAGAASAVAGANALVDIYGVFRATPGRRLVPYGEERVAKYLLSARYVPENFNAVLIGSSVSANWNTGKLGAFRVYNESINGANIVEEGALLDSALSRPGIRLVLFVAHPYLTDSHDFKTVELSRKTYWGAFGSDYLRGAYTDWLRVRFGHMQLTSDEFGTDNFEAPNELSPDLKRILRPGEDFAVDPQALQAYRETISSVRARHVQMVFIVPPLYEKLYAAKREAFRKYLEMLRTFLTPEDQLIDFTSGRYSGLRENGDNFTDGVHLRRSAADETMGMIDARLREWIALGQLRAE